MSGIVYTGLVAGYVLVGLVCARVHYQACREYGLMDAFWVLVIWPVWVTALAPLVCVWLALWAAECIYWVLLGSATLFECWCTTNWTRKETNH